MERNFLTVLNQLLVLFPAISQKQLIDCIRYVKEITEIANEIISADELLERSIDRITYLQIETENEQDEAGRQLENSSEDEDSSESDKGQIGQKIVVNADDLRTDLELERNIENVLNIFPDVERKWIESKLKRRWDIHQIVDFIASNPHEVRRITKEPKKEVLNIAMKRRRSSTNDVTSSYYMVHNEPVSQKYSRDAIKILHASFLQIEKRSISGLLQIFNGHYAPTFYCLTKLTQSDRMKDLTDSNQREIKIDLNKDYINPKKDSTVICVRKSKRIKNINLKQIIKSASADLIAEVEWCKENLVKNNFAEKNENVFTPSRAARRRAEAEYECMICCDMHIITDMVSCTDGHLFCTECLRNYTKEILYGQAKVLLTCLNDECKCGFSRKTLETALDDDYIEKLDQRLQLEDINKAEIQNLVRCKFCHFAAIVDVPIEYNKVFKCENRQCEKSFCRLCDVDWDEHVGLKCDEIETSDEMKKRKEFEEKLVNAIARECHRCKSKIIKESGCNKMTCRCAATLCYVCRAPDVGYKHFCNHARTPGRACKICKLCFLWEDTNKTIDVENLQAIQKEAQKVLKKKI